MWIECNICNDFVEIVISWTESLILNCINKKSVFRL